MAKTKEEKSLDAKRTRLWVLYRTTLTEQKEVEEYMRNHPHLHVLLTKGDPKAEANLYNDHSHVTGLYRGRLAYLINKALGTIENTYKDRTPAVLRTLADYLDHPPALRCGIENYGLLGKAQVKKKMIYGKKEGEQ